MSYVMKTVGFAGRDFYIEDWIPAMNYIRTGTAQTAAMRFESATSAHAFARRHAECLSRGYRVVRLVPKPARRKRGGA